MNPALGKAALSVGKKLFGSVAGSIGKLAGGLIGSLFSGDDDKSKETETETGTSTESIVTQKQTKPKAKVPIAKAFENLYEQVSQINPDWKPEQNLQVKLRPLLTPTAGTEDKEKATELLAGRIIKLEGFAKDSSDFYDGVEDSFKELSDSIEYVENKQAQDEAEYEKEASVERKKGFAILDKPRAWIRDKAESAKEFGMGMLIPILGLAGIALYDKKDEIAAWLDEQSEVIWKAVKSKIWEETKEALMSPWYYLFGKEGKEATETEKAQPKTKGKVRELWDNYVITPLVDSASNLVEDAKKLYGKTVEEVTEGQRKFELKMAAILTRDNTAVETDLKEIISREMNKISDDQELIEKFGSFMKIANKEPKVIDWLMKEYERRGLKDAAVTYDNSVKQFMEEHEKKLKMEKARILNNSVGGQGQGIPQPIDNVFSGTSAESAGGWFQQQYYPTERVGPTRGGKVDPDEVYDYIISKGVPENHAAGMIANITAESSFNPAALGDGRTSGGLFQHHAERFRNMVNYVGPDWRTDWKGQVDFALSEPHSKKYLAQNFATPEEASIWFTKHWEIPAYADLRAMQRLKFLPEPRTSTQIADAEPQVTPTSTQIADVKPETKPTPTQVADVEPETKPTPTQVADVKPQVTPTPTTETTTEPSANIIDFSKAKIDLEDKKQTSTPITAPSFADLQKLKYPQRNMEYEGQFDSLEEGLKLHLVDYFTSVA